MKNKIFAKFLLTCLLIFSASTIYGQSQTVNLRNGFSLVFENKITPKPTENSDQKIRTINIFSSILGVDIVHRIFADRENKVHFGYDIEVNKKEKSEKFIVKFKALSVSLFVKDSESKDLLKYPEPLEINEGDTISIDLLENPKTKVKIADFIKIIASDPNLPNEKVNQIIIPSGSTTQFITRIISDKDAIPKDLGVDEIVMQTFGTNLLINGKQIFDKKSAMGSNIYFYVKGKGRFVLSPFPRAGFDFKKIGTIDDNKITFKLNGDNYELSSITPVLCFGGKWNLWVLYEPNYRPKSEGITEEFGSDKIENVVKQ